MSNKYLNEKSIEIFKIIADELGDKEYIKFKSEFGFSDLSVDNLGTISIKGKEYKHIAMAHNSEQNGDIMADPDMEFAISKDGTVIPLTYQNDYSATYDTALLNNGNIDETKAKELS